MSAPSLVTLCTKVAYKDPNLPDLLRPHSPFLSEDLKKIFNEQIANCQNSLDFFKKTMKEYPNLTRYLIDNYPKFRENKILNIALSEAARNGNLELVRYLIEARGADVNARTNFGKTILHEAARSSNLELVRYLIEKRGADVNARTNLGETVLHFAARNGSLELVRYLIGRGSDVNAITNDGETVLHFAARNGSLELVRYLIERGADVNARTNSGYTVLHQAAISGNLELVRYLIERGADVNARTNSGYTVLHEADFSGRLELVRYLRHLRRIRICKTVLPILVAVGASFTGLGLYFLKKYNNF